MLALGFAILACLATAGSAVAQEVAQDGASTCWTCFRWEGDGCMYCSADGPTGFADHCSTPRCGRCRLNGLCVFFVTHDGRVSPPESEKALGPTTPHEADAMSAISRVPPFTVVSAPTGRAAATRRSCDGGIISKWYSRADESQIRAATSQLRL